MKTRTCLPFSIGLYFNHRGPITCRPARHRVNQARVLLALGLGLALCCSMAADGAGIVGHIGTPAGVPVQGVTVTATRTSPFQSVAASTDAAGNYGFNGLFGTYDVVPSRPGYTFTPASSNVTVRALGLDEAADFTTPASLPLATTQPAQSVTATSATLQGSVNPDGAATTAWFQYGLTISYGSA